MISQVSLNPSGMLCMASGIMPSANGKVMIDGKFYPVRKIPNNNPLRMTTKPEYREVVIVNGKTYPVQTVPNPFTCDGSKRVVSIGDKQYNVSKY